MLADNQPSSDLPSSLLRLYRLHSLRSILSLPAEEKNTIHQISLCFSDSRCDIPIYDIPPHPSYSYDPSIPRSTSTHTDTYPYPSDTVNIPSSFPGSASPIIKASLSETTAFNVANTSTTSCRSSHHITFTR
jgi:hypothetical protein